MCFCVCVCRLLQLLKDQSSVSKRFYRSSHDFNSWICKIMLCSEEQVLLLHLVVIVLQHNTSYLATRVRRESCKAPWC